jgi:hypothetical protein
LWPSYEGANDWKILELVPKKPEDEKGARESIQCVLNALEVRVMLMMRIGEVGAVGTTDIAAMGYYLVKWLSELYTLQEDTEGMAELIGTGKWWPMHCISTGSNAHLIGTRCRGRIRSLK